MVVLGCTTFAWALCSLPFAAAQVAGAEYRARLDAEQRLASHEPEFHAKCNFVMPMRQTDRGLSIMANFRLENRGAESEIDDWSLLADVNGVQLVGVMDDAVHSDSHIMTTTDGLIKRGSIRQGAISATFEGATLETISLKSVTARFRDAFGQTHIAKFADDDEIVPHLPTQRQPDG